MQESAVVRAVHGIPVVGVDVGPRSECAHYRTDLDIVAIRFTCCDTFYPCFECHEAMAGHPALRWPRARFDEAAVLCGSCGSALTINEYLASDSRCPRCGAAFNPGCKNHWVLYFEV